VVVPSACLLAGPHAELVGRLVGEGVHLQGTVALLAVGPVSVTGVQVADPLRLSSNWYWVALALLQVTSIGSPLAAADCATAIEEPRGRGVLGHGDARQRVDGDRPPGVGPMLPCVSRACTWKVCGPSRSPESVTLTLPSASVSTVGPPA
jgi:hypothetical protein